MSCSKEIVYIKTNSISSDTWDAGSGFQGTYTNVLSAPLKDVTDVEVVTASFDASSSASNIAYLTISQFDPVMQRSVTNSNSKINDSFAVFNVNQSARTVFNQFDFDNKVSFVYPVNKVDKLTFRMYDETGADLATLSNVFITLKCTTKRENLCI